MSTLLPARSAVRANLIAACLVVACLVVACLFAAATPEAHGHGTRRVATSMPADPPPDPEGHWPLDPRPAVVAAFEPPSSEWGAGHRGVDLAGYPGQVVRTALAGSVAFAGSIAGKPVVTVAHGGRRTTYEPVVATVAVGDVVTGGQPIGRLTVLHGHCVRTACLHWGLLRGDTYLDPLSLVGGGPVRLLPLWRDLPVVASSLRWRPPLARWRPPLDHLP